MVGDDGYATALARKLRLKPGQTALTFHAPAAFTAALGQALGVRNVREAATADAHELVCLFARSRAEAMAGVPHAIAATRAGGQLWIMWPKKTSAQAGDLDRDSLAVLVSTFGWGPVASIAVDETWSGLRLRPEGDIKRKPGSLVGSQPGNDEGKDSASRGQRHHAG